MALSIFFISVIFSMGIAVGSEIKNIVSATADTGGNASGDQEKIKTGDASASVDSEVFVNGEEVKIEAEIKTESKNQEASIKLVNPGTIEIITEKKECNEESDSCPVSIETKESEAENIVIAPEKKLVQENSADGFIKNVLDFFDGLIRATANN